MPRSWIKKKKKTFVYEYIKLWLILLQREECTDKENGRGENGRKGRESLEGDVRPVVKSKIGRMVTSIFP